MATTDEVQDPAACTAPRRGRRLSEDRSDAILGTVLEIVRDAGYDQLRMQDVADKAGVGLSTIYRRWPTKQDVLRAALECEASGSEKFTTTGDPRADLTNTLVEMAEGLAGDGAQTMLGFLGTMRSEPEVAQIMRETMLDPLHAHLRSLLAEVLGDDHPDLDLRATAGPAILIYGAAICGKPMDTAAMAERLAALLLAPEPGTDLRI
ncbi:TetR/AcrR family transcriptional regulator [Aquihabitans sp. G128]|uniref:TetR/AcrR family transcriptional regulator n=1 Tax=Aquihabitans sp. G128 TaxID=2849779 RepID=UPI001C234560|nr:TetR/AcrR family transcriptional regulator [Aquihabitans sp. G128]QXC59401.1 TetR/AcrR family transcriptional regulator [Aquihabitans sp. G128]